MISFASSVSEYSSLAWTNSVRGKRNIYPVLFSSFSSSLERKNFHRKSLFVSDGENQQENKSLSGEKNRKVGK